MRRNLFNKTSGIYKIQSNINGKIYIGSAVNLYNRKKVHLYHLKKLKHRNIYLQRHYDKYGSGCFLFLILEYCPKEKLIEREQFYLDNLNPEFNICKIASSTLGIKYTEEQKNKLKGKNNPMYGVHRFGELSTMYGKHHTTSAKVKISEGNKGKIGYWKGKKFSETTIIKFRENSKGEKNHFYGKTHSKEARERIRQSKIGIKISAESRNKMSIARKKFYKSEEGIMMKKHLSEISKGRIVWNKGKTLPEEMKLKIGVSCKGEKNGMYGKKHSEETKQKMRDAKRKNNGQLY